MTYFVYKLINTTYQIDNPYFENQNNAVPDFVSVDMRILDNSSGIPLLNADGKRLAEYEIADKPRLKQPFRYLWPLPILLLLITGLLLIYSKRKETNQKNRDRTPPYLKSNSMSLKKTE